MKLRYILGILMVLLAVLAVGCKKEAPPPEVTAEPEEPTQEIVVEEPAEPAEPAAPTSTEIVLTDRAAEPTDVTIKAGGSVTFSNTAEQRPHMIVGLPDQGTRIGPGESQTFVFEDAGTYQYQDLWVGTIRGTITVE